MAKEIPFFKFFTGEWSNGDITAENYKTQGVFINICAIYWTKEGEVTENFLRKKIRENKCIDELIGSEIIKVKEGSVLISFLDEQLFETEGIRKKNSKAGIASGLQRALNKKATDVERALNFGSTEAQPLREDKDKDKDKEEEEEEKKEDFLNNDFSLKVKNIIKLFDETNFENTERTLKSTKEKIRLRLIEFLEVEQIVPQFKNRQNGEVLKHFRNWLNYNLPVKSKNKTTDSVPWLTKDITGLVEPDTTLTAKRQERWDDFEERRKIDPNAVY